MTDQPPLTDEELAAIEARCNWASPGPWRKSRTTADDRVICFYDVPGLETDEIGRCVWENMLSVDHEFIAHARTDIPRLLAEVRRLNSTLEHTRYWYGCRLERLNQIAREEFSEEMRHRYFSIVANGTAESHEPPTYAQQYNTMKHRAERAEEEVRRLRAQLKNKSEASDER